MKRQRLLVPLVLLTLVLVVVSPIRLLEPAVSLSHPIRQTPKFI